MSEPVNTRAQNGVKHTHEIERERESGGEREERRGAYYVFLLLEVINPSTRVHHM